MTRAVFFDVDSTLVSYSTNPGHVPEPTREALRRLRDRGHIVALATGRSLVNAGKLMREFGFSNAALCAGAHIVLDWQTAGVTRIPDGTAKVIARMASGMGCAVFACTDYYMYTHNENPETRRYILEQSVLGDVLRPISRMRGVCLFNIYGEKLPAREDFTGVDVTYESYGIELRPMGVSKATGIRAVAERLGIPMCDTVAFGDGNNDVDMLREAGVGIAVGNGCEAAKEAADIVTEPIDEGGILNALMRLELI